MHSLGGGDRRLFSLVQGRTYAIMFGQVERYINAKLLELTEHHRLDDQNALEALIRFSEEDLKHQELFRRVERLVAAAMPEGYVFSPAPNDVAQAVLGKST